MFSNKYILFYTIGLALICSVLLAFVVNGLKPKHDLNEAVFKKREILDAVKGQIEQDVTLFTDKEIEDFFNSNVDRVVVDAKGDIVKGKDANSISLAVEEKKNENERLYPVYIFKSKEGKIFILAVRGNGLWDKIWASVAVKEDLKTITGISFGHVGETPGLGAEIKDNPNFAQSFVGKSLKDGEKYVFISLVKPGKGTNPAYEIDGISGATLTCNGVDEMIRTGLNNYVPYLNKINQ